MRVGRPELELEMATATGLNLPTKSPGEHTTLGKLAEREGFEHKVRPLKVDLFGSKLSVTFRFAAKTAPQTVG